MTKLDNAPLWITLPWLLGVAVLIVAAYICVGELLYRLHQRRRKG